MEHTCFYTCKCFLEYNYYLPILGRHVRYADKAEFCNLGGENVGSGELMDTALQQLESERQRRLNLENESKARREKIQEIYTPLHPSVYTLQMEQLSADFLSLVSYCRQPGADVAGILSKVTREKAERTFSFPVFTQQFCELFVEELEHFEASPAPKGRPNTMNNYGFLLEELGFYEGLITPLREDYLTPICRLLYPECTGLSLDSHKAFVVTYKQGHDLDLSEHYDNAEVTLNVSLGKDFHEGSLYFGKMRTEDKQECRKTYTQCLHTPTHGILHRGQHLHGALPIEDGERYNLIIWMRSSSVRNKLCPMCDDKPDLTPSEGFGDGFTQETMDVCHVT